MSDTVLIVDDSLTVRMDLAQAMEGAGFRVVPCASLTEARQALSSERASLIVLDVLLPDGDGVAFLQELRANPVTSTIAVVLLSTEVEVKDRIRGLSTGADEYVGKPYDVAFLVARAHELVRRRNASVADKKLILVIDDSLTFREELRAQLERHDYRVVCAATGEEGLRVAADLRPNAIIVDGVLPGIDGTTVIRRLRLDVALRRTPCLLLTASEDQRSELRALDAGADGFVRKGEDIDVILARLAVALRSASTTVESAETPSLLGPKRILAVDDSPTYLHELAGALRGEGYDVVLARTGEEALDLLAIQAVDCILLDLLMPGMGGQETCRRIKASSPIRDIPLIMLTALEERGAMLEGLGAGADDFLSKSSDLEVLKARVRAQIRRRQFEDENRRIREQLLQRELESSEARAAREIAETRAILVEKLELKNRELESFSYSVSHDLRAPLRSIDGFSRILLEDYADKLDDRGRDNLNRVRKAAVRMAELIDDLLELSRIGRSVLRRAPFDLSELVRTTITEIQRSDPARSVRFELEDGLDLDGDQRLIRAALENLIGNAWKFTSKTVDAVIEFGMAGGDEKNVYFVRDNGPGFDMAYSDKLFTPFQRLHTEAEFAGTGIGLATVHRIMERHGGRVWATAAVGTGATFYFSVPAGTDGGRA
ncbi:MAG TPA: response regulator [Planctomycetota bacterium]|nr:response regulator [Planctomycetota bacterium]